LQQLQFFCNFANSDFELGGKAGNATAIVQSKEFKLDAVIGVGTDYPEGKSKKFKLLIGGCLVKLKAYSVTAMKVIQFVLTEGGKSQLYVDDLNLIVIKNSSGVTFHGTAEKIITCPVSFGNKTGDVYYVPVELSGDVLTGFKLHSTEVKMDDPPSDKKPDGAGLGTWAIAAIVSGDVLLFLVICVSVGFGIFKFYKNKKLRTDDEIKTAQSMDALSGTLETKSTQAAPTSESKKEKPKEKHDKSEPESAKSPKNASEKSSKDGGQYIKFNFVNRDIIRL